MRLRKISAALVHVLTASGVLCTLYAFIAIGNRQFSLAFLWLALALFIDAVDGPLARLVDTKRVLPRFSGERLDLIIDYLNYVVLPAFIILKFPVVSGLWGNLAAGLILMTSLYHFSDLSSKTADGYFVGFPALWNLAVFYMMIFGIYEVYALLLIVVLSVMTFAPLKWVHPFRVSRLRWLTVCVVMVWSGVALVAIEAGFLVGSLEKALLIAPVLYLVILSLFRTISSNGVR